MTLAFGDLGQVTPGAGAMIAAYTVPAAKRATVKVMLANRGAATTVRVALSPGGAAIANGHYKAFDLPLAANDAITGVPMTMAVGDVVRVQSASGDVTFTINGIEEDA